jgi:hypothetical protein
MGIFDRLLPGTSPPTYKSPALALEDVAGVWTAARMRHVSLAGGQVVLTREHLIFSPWNLDQTRNWLVTWLGKAGVPRVDTVDDLLSASKLLEPVVVPIAQVADVTVLNRASWSNPLRPPQVRLTFRDGRTFDLGILANPRAMNPDPANNAALDDFLAKLAVIG